MLIHGFGDYDRIFGGLWNESRMSFAVQQYFQNGGRDAVIVRVAKEATPATWSLKCPKDKDAKFDPLKLEASSPGAWGNQLLVAVNYETGDKKPKVEAASKAEAEAAEKAEATDKAEATFFNLVVLDKGGERETLRNLSMDPASSAFVVTMLEQRSQLLRVTKASADQLKEAKVLARPPEPTEIVKEVDEIKRAVPAPVAASDGGDGNEISGAEVMPSGGSGGVRALAAADAFSLLCLPPPSESADLQPGTYRDAVAFLAGQKRRALLIVDPPAGARDAKAIKRFWAKELELQKDSAALFFPRLLAPNPKKKDLVEEFAPCGAVAGVFARTDAERGVWKAPAGTEAGVAGVSGLACTLTDAENGELNPLGINSIRSLPQIGTVLWGSRTLRGADVLADQWKYIPVRRLAFFLEDSLQRGLSWVVFEPNDEPLWSQIRLNIGSFMNGLFRQGAFQGSTPAQAYFVKCDAETTVQDDIDRGIVNIIVGFAPLKPAEFVVLKIQQMAGQGAA